MSDGCYYLRVPGPGVSASATESAPPYATPSCPAAGSTGPNGQYACKYVYPTSFLSSHIELTLPFSPAHAYPDGQICDMSEGCYYLRQPAPGLSTSYSPPMTSTTIVCPGPTTLTHGGMTYPVTEATTLTVPYAPTQPAAPPAYTPPSPPPAAYSPPAPVSPVSNCPAAGSTNSNGQYSCNPAHQYPAGQTCVMQNGCPYLVYASTTAYMVPTTPAGAVAPPPSGYMPPQPVSPVTPSNGTTPPITPYTGSAAKVAAAGVPVAMLAMGVLFL